MMIRIFKNRQFQLISLLLIFFTILFAVIIKKDFKLLFIGNLNTIPFRYFFIIISILIEHFTYRLFTNAIIISRNNTKKKYLKKRILTELCISALMFTSFCIISLLFSTSNQEKYIFDITITIINFVIIYLTISMLIKLMDIIINQHNLSCITFICIFACTDFILEHFNFFFFNNSFFDLSMIYKIYYVYEYWISIFIALILFDVFIYCILAIKIERKDFIIIYDEEN